MCMIGTAYQNKWLSRLSKEEDGRTTIILTIIQILLIQLKSGENSSNLKWNLQNNFQIQLFKENKEVQKKKNHSKFLQLLNLIE